MISATRSQSSLDHATDTLCRRLAASLLCTVGLLAYAVAPAHVSTVITNHVHGLSRSGQADALSPFGKVLKNGDVSREAALTATLGGRPVALQVDAKAR